VDAGSFPAVLVGVRLLRVDVRLLLVGVVVRLGFLGTLRQCDGATGLFDLGASVNASAVTWSSCRASPLPNTFTTSTA